MWANENVVLVYRIYMHKSLGSPFRPQVTRGISVFAILAATVCSGSTGLLRCADGVGSPTYVPAAHPLKSSVPPGAPAPLMQPSGAYKFLQTNQDGIPVAYDPCRAIQYVTNGARQTANGPLLVKEAIAAVSRAAGLVFIDDGATDEPGGFKCKFFQPERYGNQWAPVLIAWVDPADLPGDASQGCSQAVGVGSDSMYVTGELDISALPNYSDDLERAVLQYELGPLVGLAHDDEGDQLMNTVALRQKYEYQAGDLAGLAALGRGKCLDF